MKKNLFNKNLLQARSKQKKFEFSALKKTISFNFLLNSRVRTKMGFLISRFLFNSLRSANLRSQCYLTWRTGSFYSFFKLTRLTLRENFSMGLIKGLRKSSW